MSSSSTRADIVSRSLKLAGRGVELKSLANELLNDMLRSWALDYPYPSLRKFGSGYSLPGGQNTVALPSDYGAGMDNLVFGLENFRLEELSPDEFISRLGMPQLNAASGRPSFYCVDEEAGVFRFNAVADKSYPFTPVYFSVPAGIVVDAAGDNSKVWIKDDGLAVQGLVEMIYQYTGDPREFGQHQKVNDMKTDYRRGQVSMKAGGSRVQLSPSRFPNRR